MSHQTQGFRGDEYHNDSQEWAPAVQAVLSSNQQYTGPDLSGYPSVPQVTQPMPPKNTRLPLIITIIVLVLGAVAVSVFLTWDKTPGSNPVSKAFGQDSGVQACQTIAKNAAADPNGTKESDGPSDFAAAKAPFASSKYNDIRVAGTNVVDTAAQLEATGDDELGKALVLVSQMEAQWTALQTACGNHGVTVPPLPIGN